MNHAGKTLPSPRYIDSNYAGTHLTRFPHGTSLDKNMAANYCSSKFESTCTFFPLNSSYPGWKPKNNAFSLDDRRYRPSSCRPPRPPRAKPNHLQPTNHFLSRWTAGRQNNNQFLTPGSSSFLSLSVRSSLVEIQIGGREKRGRSQRGNKNGVNNFFLPFLSVSSRKSNH